jgi:hypothetical protein
MDATQLMTLVLKRLGGFRSGQVLVEKEIQELTEEECIHLGLDLLHRRLCALEGRKSGD